MKIIRVEPPDLTIRVSKHIPSIIKYINQLERDGFAYLTPKGDIYFHTGSIQSYTGRTRAEEEERKNPDEFKKDPRDFVLWKASKSDEPVWHYRSVSTGQDVPGRPGWHVQCSAISSAVFGRDLDFHYGGNDLIFPHHYNEEACCCAYHGLDTSKSLHAWSKHWLHSGHLVIKDLKMSKSLGNVVPIRSFVDDSSVNALRLMCIANHYRANVNFNEQLLSNLKSLDHKIGAFVSYLSEGLNRIRDEGFANNASVEDDQNLEGLLEKTHEEILDGVCDEFDLDRGLTSIIELTKVVYGKGWENIGARNLAETWQLLNNWCRVCGLEYGPMSGTHDEALVDLIRDFRQKVRLLALEESRSFKQAKHVGSGSQSFVSLLKECDSVRAKLDELGYVGRDEKTQAPPHGKSC